MDSREKINAGKQAEQQACHFLEREGLRLLTQNYRCKSGEIDLIMQDNTCVVFVEVRVRNNPNYGSAIESVNRHKQQKIIKAAHYYLYQQKWFNKVNCRFDVIGISYSQSKATINWIKNAFSLNF
jgi:putative endonuclease